MKYTVKKETTLLTFLMLHYSRKQAKLYLKFKQVIVNNETISQFDYPLTVGDIISIQKERSNEVGLEILYEDEELLVINKPAGLLSMSDGKEKEKTAYHVVGEYLRKQDRKARVYIVHRLDRETSGVLLFAKNEVSKQKLQENWNTIVYKRGYQAIVEGRLKESKGVIKNYLDETKTHQVYVSQKGGKLAITNYRVIKESRNFSLVEVFLETGRKNQIRVHMQHLGNSIVGDKKYGATTNPFKRLGLHAHVFAFVHPITKKKMEFIAPMPTIFTTCFNKK